MLDADDCFNPTRLTVARKFNGFTKIELAARIEVTLRAITAYESGDYAPEGESFARLQHVLGFAKEFFFGPDLEEPIPEGTSFRGWARMKSRRRDMALARGALAIYLGGYIESNFDLPLPDLPDLSREITPEAAAESLRRHWGVGALPIRNMIHLLEARGVRVFSVSIDTREVDAFSMWKDSTPFILLNTNKSAEHSRFDVAHELGHLVLHRHGAPNGKEAESQADAFASAFLMPRASVLAHAPRFATLDTVIKLKRIWTTSVAALVYRQHILGVLSDWHYRTLYMQMAQRGYLTKEPESAPRETSQVLPKIFSSLYEEGVSRSDVAETLALPLPKLEELMFGLVMTGIEGGRQGNTRNASRSNAKLTLVKK